MVRELRILSLGRVRDGHSIAPFRKEQGEALAKLGGNVEYFNIEGDGPAAYLKSRYKLNSLIDGRRFDIIHAHYGLSGLAAVSQRKVKVVVTFHGSDIWNRYVRTISLLVSYLSAWNIFISRSQRNAAAGFRSTRSCVLPCGVDLEVFRPLDKVSCRERLGLDKKKKYILFSSAFGNTVKNYPLARAALTGLPDVELLELAGHNREQVNWLLNAVDALLVTSFRESGPLIVKEALAVNLPVVSTDVGDVKECIDGIEGCFLADYDADDVAGRLRAALGVDRLHNGRQRMEKLDNKQIAEQLMQIYYRALNS